MLLTALFASLDESTSEYDAPSGTSKLDSLPSPVLVNVASVEPSGLCVNFADTVDSSYPLSDTEVAPYSAHKDIGYGLA